jgi:hypothetical protein
MKSCFGNYVMQKLLKVTNSESREKLIVSIVNNIGKLNDKKLIMKWMKITQEAANKELNFTNIDILYVPKKKNKNSKSYNPSQNNSIINNCNSHNFLIDNQNMGMINYPNLNNQHMPIPPQHFYNNNNMINYNNINNNQNYFNNNFDNNMHMMNSLNYNNNNINYDPNYQMNNMNNMNYNFNNNNNDINNNYMSNPNNIKTKMQKNFSKSLNNSSDFSNNKNNNNDKKRKNNNQKKNNNNVYNNTNQGKSSNLKLLYIFFLNH